MTYKVETHGRSRGEQKQTVDVKINRHTLTIADQVYLLRSIARVQCLMLKPARIRLSVRTAGQTIGILVLVVILNGVASMANGGEPFLALRIFNVVVLFAIVVATLFRLKRSVFRPRLYALLLETTGVARCLLASRARSEIENLVDEIADAVENPPESQKVFRVENVVLGDQINQVGDHNIGKGVPLGG